MILSETELDTEALVSAIRGKGDEVGAIQKEPYKKGDCLPEVIKIITSLPSTADQLSQDNFLDPVVDGVHGRTHAIWSAAFRASVTPSCCIMVFSMISSRSRRYRFPPSRKQLFGVDEIGIRNGPAFFEVGTAQPTIFPDMVLFAIR